MALTNLSDIDLVLHEAEHPYCTTSTRCPQMEWAGVLFWPYFERCRFTVWNYPNKLKWFLNLVDLAGKLVRPSLLSLEFEIDVILCTGMKNQAAEALLLVEVPGNVQTPIRDKISELCITASSLRKRRGDQEWVLLWSRSIDGAIQKQSHTSFLECVLYD